jgi:DNA/RNA-binding domain of Phe-tRNA-synthetase-like protein
MSQRITVDAGQLALHPVRLGVLSAEGIHIGHSPPELVHLLDDEAERFRARVPTAEALEGLPPIRQAREAYVAWGGNPKRHPPSAEALAKRVVGGKGIYRVNTVVDVNNLLSLATAWPVGSYDAARLTGPVTFRVGRSDESYQVIGGTTFSAGGLPVFADAAGIFGGTTRDSDRTKITEHTTTLLMVVIAFTIDEDLTPVLARGAELLKAYCGTPKVEITQVN